MVRLSLTQSPENSKIVFVTQTKLKKLVVAQLRATELTVSIFENPLCIYLILFQRTGPFFGRSWQFRIRWGLYQIWSLQ